MSYVLNIRRGFMKKIFLLILILFLPFCAFAKGDNEFEKIYKKTIMIDLDGVLDNYTTYDKNSIPEIKTGAADFIKRLDKTGKYELVLFTTRSPKLATEWLIQNKIDKYFKDVTNVKYPAYIYLDDRAIQFRGDYKTTFEKIEKFNIYWK